MPLKYGILINRNFASNRSGGLMFNVRVSLGFTEERALSAITVIFSNMHIWDSSFLVDGPITKVRYDKHAFPLNLLSIEDPDLQIPRTTLSIYAEDVKGATNQIIKTLTDFGCQATELPGPSPLEASTAFVLCEDFAGWAIFVHNFSQE